MNRTCLECGLRIQGRIDKKFCSDPCRTAYHNRRAPLAQPAVRNINHALLNNRRILERFAHGHDSVIRREALLKYGYDFTYSTHSTLGKNGQLYRHVYEQAYLEIDAERIRVLPPMPKLIP